ncbi:MAG: LPS export ABC transporter periplasmic protein LptC [Rickettsiales bacterium]|nr:LPS export ABC transporter periplasmic protein LptC [Rickettsiales bacterium]
MASHAAYTRFVSLSKRFLWLLVAVVVAIIVWIASDSDSENSARIVFSNMSKKVTQAALMQNIMNNPHYQGVDTKNRPYTVMADRATQLDKDTVELFNIRADIALEKGVWIALNAGSGTLNLVTKKLELQNGVDVFYDKGYEFRTAYVHVDIQEGSAYGEADVEGQGPIGTLKAKGFSVTGHGKTIRFNDSVSIRLYR